MQLGLAGRVALITGGARGFGLSIAQTLAREGCVTYLGDLDERAAGEAAARLREEGLRAQARRLDVTDGAGVTGTIDEIVQTHKRIDILVNNAGILKTGSLAASSVADWEDVARVNVSGMLACSFAVLPHMTERSYGKIVNVASVSALRGSGAIGNALYAASKAAVVALTKGFASEFGPRGVNVNAVAPAVAETAMTEGSLHSSAVRERTLRAIPMGRFATGGDVGNVAAFLASDVASYMSGSIVVVDGGYLTG